MRDIRIAIARALYVGLSAKDPITIRATSALQFPKMVANGELRRFQAA